MRICGYELNSSCHSEGLPFRLEQGVCICYLNGVANLEIRLRSDATRLKGEVPCILAHVLSDTLIWGLGFSEAITARWPQLSEALQLRLRDLHPRPALGEVLWTSAESGIDLAHLVVERSYNMPPVGLDLRALQTSLARVAERAFVINATVHLPPLGTGLSSGCWPDVYSVMREALVDRGISVVVHCLGGQPPR
jgi:hypothetical protein